MASADAAPSLRIAVAWSERPGHADETIVEVATGATLEDAIRAAGILERVPGGALEALKVGVWGRVRPLGTALRPGDRVEVYRPLKVDPMEARRLRERRQRGLTCSRRR